MNEEIIKKIIDVAADFSGINFENYKKTTLGRSIDRRMAVKNIKDYGEYFEMFSNSAQEQQALCDYMLVGVTGFFRDYSAFESLYANVFPKLPYNAGMLRIWSIACSTGEEAYSVAIGLQEYMKRNSLSCEIKIFASDVDDCAVKLASRGKYSAESVEKLPADIVEQYFDCIPEGYKIKDYVRKMIVFARHDVMSDPSFSNLDLIVCRNFLIYLNEAEKNRMISNFYYLLNGSGFLFLGVSESLGANMDIYEAVDKKYKIYRCVPGSSSRLADFPYNVARSVSRVDAYVGGAAPETKRDIQIFKAMFKIMPPSVLVDGNGEIVHLHNGADKFLRFKTGSFKATIFDNVPEELKPYISSIFRRLNGGQEKVAETITGLGCFEEEVLILFGASLVINREKHYVFYFCNGKHIQSERTVINHSSVGSERIAELENELRNYDDTLRVTLGELEFSNEELQSTNEELMAANEELQSANQEMQSVNEELNSLNQQHRNNIEELKRLNEDMDNLLVAGEIGALYIDENLNIRRITHMVDEITNLRMNDIGRPITHIKFMNEYDDFVSDVKAVINEFKIVEREISDDKGHIWLVRIRTYYNAELVKSGALVTFFDIARRLATAKFELNQLINAIPGGVVQFWFNVKKIGIAYASKGFYDLIGYSKDEYNHLERKNDGTAVLYNEDKQFFFKEIKRCMDSKQVLDVEIRLINKNQIPIWVQIKAAIVESYAEKIFIQSIVLDVSQKHELEEERARQAEIMRFFAELSADVIFDYDIEKDTLKGLRYGEDTTEENNYEDFCSKRIFDSEMFFFEEDNASKLAELLRSGRQSINDELCYAPQGERLRWMNIVAKTIYADDKPVRVLGKLVDITEKKKKEQELIRQTQCDSLTGLYYRKELSDCVEQKLEEYKDCNCALMIIDFDNFKNINDNLGHLFGDQVLVNISDGLKEMFAENALIGRIGGDEFSVFMYDVDSRETVAEYAEGVENLFHNSYVGETELSNISASIGIAYSDKERISTDELFMRADQAMYSVKENGKNNYEFYSAIDKTWYIEKANAFLKGADVNELKKNAYKECDIVNFSIDLMYETKDLNSAINMLLYKAAQYFGFNRIFISEVIEKSCIVATYELVDGRILKSDKVFWFTDSEWQEILDFFRYHDILSTNSDSLDLPFSFRKRLKARNVGAFIYCPFFRNDEFAGVIEFDCVEGHTKYEQYQLEEMKKLTKILSICLLNVRVFKDIYNKAEKLEMYDSVTGLLKFNKFMDAARNAMKEKDEGTEYIIVYSDLSNFKYINEIYGTETGDKILKLFGAFMISREIDKTIGSRLFSDNFVFLKKILKSAKDDELKVMIKSVNREFSYDIKKYYPNSNIAVTSGICRVSSSADLSKAIDDANCARKEAKSLNNNYCLVYDTQMETEKNRRYNILNSIGNAINNDHLYFVLQPKIDLSNEKVVGAEALVRWRMADGSLMNPIEFVPVCESNGSIIEVDFYVYNKVFEYIHLRLRNNEKVVPISLNVSRRHLESPDFIERVDGLFKKYNIDAKYIEFELTENVFIENMQNASYLLESLRKMGFAVSMDDFGSGFSSLNMLKNLPIDILKMDKGFLNDGELKKNTEIVISSVINMAKELEITVLCEGVETKNQADFLKKSGCNLAQGYYFAKPLLVADFEKYLMLH